MADSEVRQKFEAAKVAHDEFWRGLGIERLLIPDDFRTGFKEGFFAGMRAGEIAQQGKIAEQVLDILDELTPQDAEVTEPVCVAYQRIAKLLLSDPAAPEEKKP